MWITTERTLTKLKHVAHFVANGGVSLPGLWHALGCVLESRGHQAAAARAHERAIAAADRSGNRSMFKTRQHWQFALERALHELGASQVREPLFFCNAAPEHASAVSPSQRRQSPGYYEARWKFQGLRIDGFLNWTPTDDRIVRVLLDGKLLREVTAAKMPFLPPYFQLTLQRSTVDKMRVDSVLRLENRHGRPLLFDGCSATRLLVPHGSGLLRDGSGVDKKGFLRSEGNDLEVRQQGFLAIYDKARDAFADEFDTPLFLLYGTLLGYCRHGDFIPGDDDFDVGYLSDQTTPNEVKRQAMEMAVRLVVAGFAVSFNRNGRLFRLRLPSFPPNIHLDVHPVWAEGPNVWIHPQACLACSTTDFLPVYRGTMRGVPVNVPNNSEAFLGAYYGGGWKIPDPAYSTASRHIPRTVTKHLGRALVTPSDFAKMQRDIVARTGSTDALARLVSIGSHSLYPLCKYEAQCDW